MSAVLDIPIDATGIFEIQTESGTDYVLELGGEVDVVTRKPGMRRPVSGGVETRLEGDFTPLPLLGRSDISQGHSADFTVALEDNVTRTSTAPVSFILQH